MTEEDNNDADVLSTVRFDETGNYLATGDRGGRVVVFQRSDVGRERYSRKRRHSFVAGEIDRGFSGGEGSRELVGMRGASSAEYSFYAEFQSHTPEFDCLKSAEIEEKINKVCKVVYSLVAHKRFPVFGLSCFNLPFTPPLCAS